ARRTRDDIPRSDRMAFGADPYLALAGENEEHLLVDAVIVEREGPLAGRHGCHIVSELPRAEPPADVAEARLELVRRMFCARRSRALAPIAKFDVGNIENRVAHGSSIDEFPAEMIGGNCDVPADQRLARADAVGRSNSGSVPSTCAPSIASSRSLVATPPRAEKPPDLRPAATTRWHGTIGANGFFPIASPTSRAISGSPNRAAISP